MKIGHAPFAQYIINKFQNQPEMADQLYFLVCVPFRIAIFSLAFVFRYQKYTPWLIGICALLSIINLLTTKIIKNLWYSRRLLIVISFLILFSCMYTIVIPNIITPNITVVLLYSTIIFGVSQKIII